MELGRAGELAQGIPPPQARPTSRRVNWRAMIVPLIGLVVALGYAGAQLLYEGVAGLPMLLGAIVPCLAAVAAWWTRTTLKANRLGAWLGLAGGLTFWAA